MAAGGAAGRSLEKDHRALQEFQDAETRARVLSRSPTVIRSAEPSVRRPAEAARRLLLLRGVNPVTSIEMIELFVEHVFGFEPPDYTLHRSPGRDLVLLQLKRPVSEDLQTFQAGFSRRTLDGSRITVEPVRRTVSVLVENLRPRTCTDSLALYFEIRHDHRVKEVTMTSEGAARVSFVHPEAAGIVLGGKHTLDGAELVVKPDFSSLQPTDAAASPGPEGNREAPDEGRVDATVSNYSARFSKTLFTLRPEEANFLMRPEVREHLLQVADAKGFPCSYAVSGCNVAVTAAAQDTADQARSFLESQLRSFDVELDAAQQSALNSKEWAEFLQTLAFASVSERRGVISVLTLRGREEEKTDAILGVLTPAVDEALVAMEPGVLRYVQIHCHQLLADMDQVSIFPVEAEDVCGLKIHGPATACLMAKEVLQGVVSSVVTKVITVSVPGISRFLEENECRSIMTEMKDKFQVYISVEYVPWKPPPHEDLFDTAWRIVSRRNLPKFSTAGPGPSWAGLNGAFDRGLLDQAGKIISNVGGQMPRPLSDAGPLSDMDLYTDTTVTSPPDVTPKGQTSLDGLDEESQLSLAIQYSMQSNHRSVQEDEELQRALELSREMDRGSRGGRRANAPDGIGGGCVRDATAPANRVDLVVFAGYSCDLIRVQIAFCKRVALRRAEESVECGNMGNLNEFHLKCLEVIERKHAVQVDIRGRLIAVSGFRDYVTPAVRDVRLLLENISNTMSDQDIPRTVQWVSDSRPYSPEATVVIETAWRRRQGNLDVLLDHQPHTISFERMEELCISSGRTVKIFRRLLTAGDSGQDLQEEEYSLLSNPPAATELDAASQEFQSVTKDFYDSMKTPQRGIRVLKVEKLMNRLLFDQYKLKRASVLQQSSQPTFERTLYHGTGEASVQEICVHGFNRSFCGKNATVYGQGVYFAVNASLSAQDRYSPPDKDGHKYIFVAKVLTGDFTKGSKFMRTAPLKESGEIPLRYDSVTDNVSRPSMFVIFNDTQAFPEYLITCQNARQ